MERLKLVSIEAKPKKLIKSAGWFETVRISEAAKSHLEIIFDCITSGKPIPEKYYRKNRQSTPDWMLSTHGILHLHMGHAGTRELLFAIQYEDAVFLIGLTDHEPFREKPIGFSLINRAKAAIKKHEAAKDGDEADGAMKEALLKRERRWPRSPAKSK